MASQFPSACSVRLLNILDEHPNICGTDVLCFYRSMRRSTVYTTLSRLERTGFVVSQRDAKRDCSAAPRRNYRLTELGRQIVSMAKALEKI